MEAAPHRRLVAEVGRRGFMIPLRALRARVGDAGVSKILRSLTVTEKLAHGRPQGHAEKLYAYLRWTSPAGAEFLVIPRVKGPHFLAKVVDEAVAAGAALGSGAALPPPRRVDPARLASRAPLFPYQAAAIEHLCGAAGPLGSNAGLLGGVAYLQMDTGLGKTRVGCGVVARRGEPALVVVPTCAIADQWVEEFAGSYPGLAVAVYHNPTAKTRKAPPGPATHDVVIIIVNTLRTKDPEFLEGFGTVVLDEAHEYHSKVNSKVLWLSQTRAVLGLSATPQEHPGGLDRYIKFHLGDTIFPAAIPEFNTRAVNFRGEVRVIEYLGHPDFAATAVSALGTTSAIGTIGNVIQDPCRMRLVAAEVVRLFRLHETAGPAELGRLGLGRRPAGAATPDHPAGEVRCHGVLVFAEHRDYLVLLRDALLEQLRPADIITEADDDADDDAADDDDDDAAADDDDAAADAADAAADAAKVSVLRGGVAKTAVGDARRAGAHVVLTTYGFGRRGISLPNMTSIVLATPRRNGMNQVLGRVLRRGSDESIVRQVVDIVDVSTGLRGQASARRAVYAKKQFPVAKEKITWETYAGAAEGAAEGGGDSEENGLAALANDELMALLYNGIQ